MNKIDTELPGGDLQTVVILLFVWEQEGDARVRGSHLVMRNFGLFYAPLEAILRKVESDCSCFGLEIILFKRVQYWTESHHQSAYPCKRIRIGG